MHYIQRYIQRSRTEDGISYSREFKWNDSHGGFSFDCDSMGNVEVEHKEGQENYARCIDGSFDVTDLGVLETKWTRRHRAIIECPYCEEHVVLRNSTNACNCGADYNMSGQRLAPRSEWGEETGEHWTECY